MMQEEVGIKYFWDTYAIAESIHGNLNYDKFSQEPVIITIFNLAEIYWFALKHYNEKQSEEIYENYKDCVVEINDETLKKAIKFRKDHKKKDLSYADCIGYTYALENNLVFLTGDKEFENLPGVEFVK